MSEQLLPCPFCGGTAQHNNSDTSAYEWYECSVCGVKTIGVNPNDYYSQSRPTPESQWQRRAPDPRILAKVERRIEVLEDKLYAIEAGDNFMDDAEDLSERKDELKDLLRELEG